MSDVEINWESVARFLGVSVAEAKATRLDGKAATDPAIPALLSLLDERMDALEARFDELALRMSNAFMRLSDVEISDASRRRLDEVYESMQGEKARAAMQAAFSGRDLAESAKQRLLLDESCFEGLDEIVVDATTAEKLADRMENPRQPTPALRDLFHPTATDVTPSVDPAAHSAGRPEAQSPGAMSASSGTPGGGSDGLILVRNTSTPEAAEFWRLAEQAGHAREERNNHTSDPDRGATVVVRIHELYPSFAKFVERLPSGQVVVDEYGTLYTLPADAVPGRG